MMLYFIKDEDFEGNFFPILKEVEYIFDNLLNDQQRKYYNSYKSLKLWPSAVILEDS